MYFVSGDQERLDAARGAQSRLTHPYERFMLDAPTPDYAPHRSVTAGPNINSVLEQVSPPLARLHKDGWDSVFCPICRERVMPFSRIDCKSAACCGYELCAEAW
jgi:hypothetical protein